MAIKNFADVGYSLTQGPLTVLSRLPIVAKRAPTTADTGYQIGQLWIYPGTQAAYILVQVASGAATWQLIETGGGAGVFSSLVVNPGPTSLSTVGNGAVSIGNATNTGAITVTVGTGNFSLVGGGNTVGIANDAAANVTILGSTTGAASLALQTGTGNFTLNGVGASTYAIGASTTTGTITVGGTAQTGTITLGSSSGTNIVAVGAGSGATTVNIANGAGANAVNIANGGVAAKTVVIGSISTTSALTLQAGSGGITATGSATVSGTLGVAGITSVATGTAVTAGGADIMILGSGVGAPFICVGSGAPGGGFTAPQGSIYLRTDGSSTSTRMYINTNGATTWTNVVTAA